MHCLAETKLFICLLLGGGGEEKKKEGGKSPNFPSTFSYMRPPKVPVQRGPTPAPAPPAPPRPRPRHGCADKALRGAGGFQAGRARENERRRHLSLIFRCWAPAICCMRSRAAVPRRGCRGRGGELGESGFLRSTSISPSKLLLRK